MTCRVSIVVSGFGVRPASWDRLRSCLAAIADQQVPGVEVLLVETAGLPGHVSSDFHETLPGLKMISCPDGDPWVRKTAGARAATAPIIAFLDADCMPLAGWLQAMLETFEYYPEVAVLRGRDKVRW